MWERRFEVAVEIAVDRWRNGATLRFLANSRPAPGIAPEQVRVLTIGDDGVGCPAVPDQNARATVMNSSARR